MVPGKRGCDAPDGKVVRHLLAVHDQMRFGVNRVSHRAQRLQHLPGIAPLEQRAGGSSGYARHQQIKVGPEPYRHRLRLEERARVRVHEGAATG